VLDTFASVAHLSLRCGAPRSAIAIGISKREMTHCWKTLALALACLLATASAKAEQVHAIAMHGLPKHASGFSYFPYVNPSAPKGGRLVIGTLGTFDSLNPFIIKGVSPPNVREYVYESLMARSGDEPFSLYGLIAESVEVPEDRSSITFNLRAEARFSDGHPITPEDVIFSHSVLKDKGWPYHRSHYGKVAKAEKTGPRSVRFTFAAPGDREIPLIMGLMPVLPGHKLDAETFERTTLEPPVGSGPYTIVRVDAGRSVIYRRNPEWWARDLAVTRGRFNFDEVRVEFFRDAASMFEAFKSGEIDVRAEDEPGRWIEGYNFPAVADGRVIKREFDTRLPSGMPALVFNTRRPIFADERVRRAFIHLFDAEWINRSLFNDVYKRTQSFFERSDLSSAGRPADAAERALLAPFSQYVKPEIMEGIYRLPVTDGSGENRASLQAAHKLLTEAGWKLEGGHLVKGGVPLAIEFLAQTRQQERLLLSYARALERLGIALRVRQVDTAQYASRLKTFDFDMIQFTWGSSLSPGNEQISRWGSKAADIEGSLNYPGVKNPAADAMIEALLAATSAEDFTTAVRAFDRVLRSGDYLIPLFYLPKVWVAHWSQLRFPTVAPLGGYDLDTWWSEGTK
jgi:peptide/nickel transport system substrate-binding protein